MKNARLFVHEHYLFRETNSELRGKDYVQQYIVFRGLTVSFEDQICPGQISEHINYSPQVEATVLLLLYYPSNLFRNRRSFEN